MKNMSLNEGNEKWVTFHNASGQLSGFKGQQAGVVECRSGSVHLWAAVLPLFAFNNCTSQIARNLDPSLALRFICVIQTEGMLRRGEGMEGRKESTWSWLSIHSSSSPSLLTPLSLSLSCLQFIDWCLIDRMDCLRNRTWHASSCTIGSRKVHASQQVQQIMRACNLSFRKAGGGAEQKCKIGKRFLPPDCTIDLQ